MSLQTRNLILLTAAFVGSGLGQQTYNFVSVDYPGAVVTSVNGIDSNGNIVGHASIQQNGSLHGVGFIRSASGDIVTLNDPQAVQSTYPNGVNDSGVVVGGYTNGSNQGFGFYLSKSTGYLTVNKGTNTELTGISTNGFVVGRYTSGNIIGFAQTTYGQTQVLPNLNGLPVRPLGINSSKVVVGGDEASTVPGIQQDGFILNQSGTYQLVDYPGAYITTLTGINDAGATVGTYTKSVNGFAQGGGFLYSKGQFTDLSFGDNSTFPSGINASGVIVGTYYDANAVSHGFIATPAQ